MHVLHDTVFLAAPTFRSRAYAQIMAQCDIVPSRVLMLPGSEPQWHGPASIQVAFPDVRSIEFSPGVPAHLTMAEMGVPISQANSADINDAAFIAQLAGYSESIVIFSGLGGAIVRRPALSLGKRFLHVHGGWAPAYRGSTAFYYSIIEEGLIGATALWLAEELDAGPILARSKFVPLPSMDIDRIQDPIVRAIVLASVLEKRQVTGTYPEGNAETEHARTFFVIHPILKHVALRRSENIRVS